MSALKRAVLSLVGDTMFRSAAVVGIDTLAPRFLRITFSGVELRDVRWVPGDKVQIDVGSWEVRTYTPVAWDPLRGETEIVAHQHAQDTPAGQWLQSIELGAASKLFGPRRSLDVSSTRDDLVIVGDETSLGLAAALVRTRRKAAVVVEASHREATATALDRLGVDRPRIVERRESHAHLDDLAATLREELARRPGATLVFSGRARTVQELRTRLRDEPALRTARVKAYWSEGKVGLD